jgi:hypothetical protein
LSTGLHRSLVRMCSWLAAQLSKNDLRAAGADCAGPWGLGGSGGSWLSGSRPVAAEAAGGVRILEVRWVAVKAFSPLCLGLSHLAAWANQCDGSGAKMMAQSGGRVKQAIRVFSTGMAWQNPPSRRARGRLAQVGWMGAA